MISPKVFVQQPTPVIATETLTLKAEGKESRADSGRTFPDGGSIASRYHLNSTVGASNAEDVEQGVQAGPAPDIGRSQQWVTAQFK